MNPVRIVTGTAVPLDRSDVDTDQIIPAEWLKRVERTGFEQGLFATWRDDRDFVLNDERYSRATMIVAGRHVNENLTAWIVPGSGIVKEQAEAEGLHKIFLAAGFEWREPGCSMCLAMNPDKLSPEERCASTSNRNFEGRQGFKGRTHLVSPAMAAAAAIAGHFVDVRDWR